MTLGLLGVDWGDFPRTQSIVICARNLPMRLPCTEEIVMRVNITLPALVAALAAGGCQDSSTAPRELSVPAIAAPDRPGPEKADGADEAEEANKPNFNLNVVLRGEGSGRIKFRQPKGDGTT